jgi:MFS family permease
MTTELLLCLRKRNGQLTWNSPLLAFFSCFFIWPFTARFGRRWSLVLASTIFNVGAVVQTINTHHLAGFYIARFVSGVGVGMATVIVPMYSAEMAPKNIRGMLGSMFQFFFTLGVMTSYWVDYAASIHIPDDSSAQWQLPVGLQLVPGTILGLGMLFTKESTRWLAKTNRREEALQSLIWVRGGDSPEVQEEYVIPNGDILLTFGRRLASDRHVLPQVRRDCSQHRRRESYQGWLDLERAY